MSADGSALDAPVPEASETSSDAASALVTVHVLREGAALAGVTVVFSDATGAVTGAAQTDAGGAMASAVPSGGAITAVFGTIQQPRLITILGVEPGDTLTVNDPTGNRASVPPAQARLDTVPDGAPPGTASYWFSAGYCVQLFSTLPAVRDLETECFKDGKFHVLVRAFSGQGAELGYAFQRGNAVSQDGGVTSIVVGGSWSKTATFQSIGLVHPLDAGGPYNATFSEVADGVPSTWTATNVERPDGGFTSPSFITHPGFGEKAVHRGMREQGEST